jgi:hypothetical protein
MDAVVNTSFFYDDVSFSIPEFSRSVYLKGVGMGAVTGLVTPDPTGPVPFFNGWMGIAPYQSMHTNMQQFSFMKQLVDSNTITNDVIAINARDASDTNGSDTLAKFGGYDPEMYDASTLKILKT